MRGIVNRLDYLEDLGINALYLNPVFKANTNHRYDTCDYYEVDPALGGNKDLRELVEALHQRGMRIILAGVFNHCGDGFWAFEDVKAKGQDSGYVNWFLPRSLPIRSTPLSYYTCGGCWYLPKFNLANPETRKYVLDVAAHWSREFGIDGWRLDTPCKIPIEFWREFRNVVKPINPDSYLVGEIWRDGSPWIQGDSFDGVTNFRLRNLILEYCAYDTLDAEDFAYEIDQLLGDYTDSVHFMLNFLSCHDTPRALTIFRGDVDRLKTAITLLLTFPGAPLIFYGDEIGMTGGQDPDCRGSMIWDEARWSQRIRDWYRGLIGFRRNHFALRRGNFKMLLAFDGLIVYQRAQQGDEVIVILNPGRAVSKLAIPAPSGAREYLDPFQGVTFKVEGGHIDAGDIPARSSFVLVPYQDTEI